jgi:hypothetical protein
VYTRLQFLQFMNGSIGMFSDTPLGMMMIAGWTDAESFHEFYEALEIFRRYVMRETLPSAFLKWDRDNPREEGFEHP